MKKVSKEIFQYHKFVEFKNLPDDYFEIAYAKVDVNKEVIKRRLKLDTLEGLTFPVYEEESGINFDDLESNLTLPTVCVLSYRILSIEDYYKLSIDYPDYDMKEVIEELKELE